MESPAPLLPPPSASGHRHTFGVARAGEWLGWAVLPALVVMQFFDLRSGLHGHPEVYSFFLIGFTLVALCAAPQLLRRGAMGTAGKVMLGSFGLLLAWALYSSLVTKLPRLFMPRVAIGRIYLVVPVLTAMATLLAAWGIAAGVPVHRRTSLTWQASVVLAVTSLLAWPRNALANGTIRLATGMGGAAVYHVVLLLALGQLLAAALAPGRVPAALPMRWQRGVRPVSWTGAVVCAVGMLLTSSRAALVCLACFVLLLCLLLAVRGRARLVAPLMGGLVVAMALVMVAFPVARRLLQSDDAGRSVNLRTAVHVFRASGHNQLFGVGSGRMWPWYAFETGHAPIPWHGIIATGYGRGTTNPHSLVLGVMVELGLVGLALLLVLVGTLLWCAVSRWRRVVEQSENSLSSLAPLLPLLAVVSTLPAFLFDYYLLKNFAISFWWWLVVALEAGVSGAHVNARETS